MQNGRPIGMKTRIRLLIALTILAWATQTLLQQWGYGQEVTGAAPTRFVPHEAQLRGGTLELRKEATVIGGEVRLKQICRWSDADREAFAAIENLVMMRIASETPYRTISLDEIKSTLHDAGVNLGRIRFVGATLCTVSRRDVVFDEGDALRQWVAAKENAIDQTETDPTQLQPAQTLSVTAPVQPSQPAPTLAADRTDFRPVVAEPVSTATINAVPPAARQPIERPVHRQLRDVLIEELARQAGVPVEALVVDFKPQDERLLNLTEPHFRFHATLKRGKSMGNTAWDVLIDSNGEARKALITATSRCWQQQLVVTKPIAHRQVIRDEDVLERRTLVDQLDDTPLVTRENAVGQMAGLELRPGTVLNARMIEAVPLVKTGQLVGVTIRQGGVEIRSVARALEAGTYGQTIRVRNETTKDVFEVTMTGPQEAVMGGGLTPAVASVGQ